MNKTTKATLDQAKRKEGIMEPGTDVFVGYHCQDCTHWERINGKGRCLLTGEDKWPGDTACQEFAQ